MSWDRKPCGSEKGSCPQRPDIPGCRPIPGVKADASLRRKFGYRVMILHSCSRLGRGPSIDLRKAISMRGGSPPPVVQETYLAASQFPPTMTDAHGPFHKPTAW